jgi:peptidoglycan hydrolase-like protein with peptidoglycan-binding domain
LGRRFGFFRPGFGFRRPGFGFRRRFGFFRRPPFGFGTGLGTGFGQPTAGGPGAAVSELVSWAQGCLSQISSEPVPQNGILGPSTRRAIAAFQTENQLAATGVLDNQTIAALQAACSAEGDEGASGGE